MGDRLAAPLRALARAWGVQLSYTDVNGRRRSASVEGAIGVLRALGAPVDTPDDLGPALQAKLDELAATLVEPVTVCWEGEQPAVEIRTGERADLEIALEDGTTHGWSIARGEPVRRVRVPLELPIGYHTVRVSSAGRSAETLLLHAPLRAASWNDRSWGVFMPAYAIRTARDWGAGDMGALADLLEMIGRAGGKVVATLPLLPVFLDDPFEPSPYSPVSKLFWNEFFLDVERLPEASSCPEVAESLRSDRLREQVAALRARPTVDYKALAALKRSLLLDLARWVGAQEGDLGGSFRAHVAADESLRDYAAFRARTAADGPWPGWNDGESRSADDELYHRYVQWAMQRQLKDLHARGDAVGSTLLFDMPLGVHPLGYDAYRYRDVFASDADGGAPPDGFFTKGQNWGFHPMHPVALRAQRYAYPIACIRHLLRHARVVRIDHVMGLHRMWWIPPGAEASDGAYVRYRPEEMYAILAIESVRTGALIVGEDLGTVPTEVRRAMSVRSIQRTYVVQEEVDAERGLNRIPQACVAAVNTHDMPPFAMFWRATDVDRRVDMGLFNEREGDEERRVRRNKRYALARSIGTREDADEQAVLRATLGHLGRSRARVVIANLEDLWGETEPQNVPGTGEGFDNWRRRGKHAIESPGMARALEVLQELDRTRRGRSDA